MLGLLVLEVSNLAATLATSSGRRRLLGPEWEPVELARVSVYGELCGGRYPHPVVPDIPGLRPVQKGIWYSPGLVYVGFDLLLTPQVSNTVPADAAPRAAADTPQYAGYAQARVACEEAGFMFAAPLCVGSLSDCLAFGERFSSTLPLRLGLPALGSDNLAEGVVIRAVTAPGPARFPSQRPMFKGPYLAR